MRRPSALNCEADVDDTLAWCDEEVSATTSRSSLTVAVWAKLELLVIMDCAVSEETWTEARAASHIGRRGAYGA